MLSRERGRERNYTPKAFNPRQRTASEIRFVSKATTEALWAGGVNERARYIHPLTSTFVLNLLSSGFFLCVVARESASREIACIVRVRRLRRLRAQHHLEYEAIYAVKIPSSAIDVKPQHDKYDFIMKPAGATLLPYQYLQCDEIMFDYSFSSFSCRSLEP